MPEITVCTRLGVCVFLADISRIQSVIWRARVREGTRIIVEMYFFRNRRSMNSEDMLGTKIDSLGSHSSVCCDEGSIEDNFRGIGDGCFLASAATTIPNVLPEPVISLSMMLWWARIAGIRDFCISVGALIPSLSSEFVMFCVIPRSPNVGLLSFIALFTFVQKKSLFVEYFTACISFRNTVILNPASLDGGGWKTIRLRELLNTSFFYCPTGNH